MRRYRLFAGDIARLGRCLTPPPPRKVAIVTGQPGADHWIKVGAVDGARGWREPAPRSWLTDGGAHPRRAGRGRGRDRCKSQQSFSDLISTTIIIWTWSHRLSWLFTLKRITSGVPSSNQAPIGGFVSHRCIRTYNSDILHLYGRIGLSTKVVVLP